MQVKILGTAAAEGLPALFCCCDTCRTAREQGGKDLRTRSGTLIDGNLMIDFSPDTFHHALRHKLQLADVRHLLLTHSHSDHLYPCDLDMRHTPYAHLDGQPALKVYGTRKLLKKCRRQFGRTWAPRNLDLTAIKPLQTVVLDADTQVTALPAQHMLREPALLFAVERGGKRLLYGHDTGLFPELVWQTLRGRRFDLVLLDCTMMTGRDGGNHMGLPDCLDTKARMERENMADSRTRFVLTHFSHNGGLSHAQLEAAASPHGFDVAYDGVEYTL